MRKKPKRVRGLTRMPELSGKPDFRISNVVAIPKSTETQNGAASNDKRVSGKGECES